MARKPASADSGGTNSPPPDNEEAMMLSGIAKMDSLEEIAVNARKAISRFRKEFSATTGIKLHVFDQARRERGLERKESVEDQAALMRLRRYLKLPVGAQAELFPADAPAPTQDAAYIDGFTKGIAGKGERKPPPEFSSGKQQQSWLQGWDEGQVKLGTDYWGKKKFDKDPPPPKAGEAKGPSGKGKVVSLADKKAEKEAAAAAPSKPPGVPAKADKPDATAAVVKRVADKKKAEKSAAKAKDAKDKPADKAAEKPRTKAEEAALNGGVKMAPPGAQKGGGDFDDDDLVVKKGEKGGAADGDDDFELDDDFDLEEEGADT
jgi:ribosome modulation factor